MKCEYCLCKIEKSKEQGKPRATILSLIENEVGAIVHNDCANLAEIDEQWKQSYISVTMYEMYGNPN